MVFPLDVVEPTANSKQRLIRSKVVLRFGDIHEAYGLQKLDTIRLLLEIPGKIISASATCIYTIYALRFKLADSAPAICNIGVIWTSCRLGKYTKFPLKVLHAAKAINLTESQIIKPYSFWTRSARAAAF